MRPGHGAAGEPSSRRARRAGSLSTAPSASRGSKLQDPARSAGRPLPAQCRRSAASPHRAGRPARGRRRLRGSIPSTGRSRSWTALTVCFFAFVEYDVGPRGATGCCATSHSHSTLDTAGVARLGGRSAAAGVTSSDGSTCGDNHPRACASVRKAPSRSRPISPLRAISRTVSPAGSRRNAWLSSIAPIRCVDEHTLGIGAMSEGLGGRHIAPPDASLCRERDGDLHTRRPHFRGMNLFLQHARNISQTSVTFCHILATQCKSKGNSARRPTPRTAAPSRQPAPQRFDTHLYPWGSAAGTPVAVGVSLRPPLAPCRVPGAEAIALGSLSRLLLIARRRERMRCVPGVHYRERPLKLISPATLWEFPGIPGRPCDFSSSASRAGLRAVALHRHRLKAA